MPPTHRPAYNTHTTHPSHCQTNGACYPSIHPSLPPSMVYFLALPTTPPLISSASAPSEPGLCGMKIVWWPDWAPRSLSVSKYCVMRTRSRTSLAPMPLMFLEKSCTLSRRPSTIALRCRAIPSPCRYLDSASASAFLTINTLSASAFSWVATRCRLLALISFMASRTRRSGDTSVTNVLMIVQPNSSMDLRSSSLTAVAISSLLSKTSSRF
mmetsp:Transcript_51042/g.128064  ORF Transcript_51042/g.128064 Transcript_51042/m.128064 type:complete len:212 (+) Transcript_51042:116-751(+)